MRKTYNQYTGYKYTREEILKLCEECESKTDFCNKGYLKMAKKHNILDECDTIFKNRDKINKIDKIKKLEDDIDKVIHNFKSISQFRSKHPKFYYYIITYKIEKYLNAFIRQKFSTQQQICKIILETLLDEECEYNNRKILNGKELDIFFPIYRLACEYNGYYWHINNVDKDNQKKKLCENSNISLLVVSEPNLNSFTTIENSIRGIKNQFINFLPQINQITGNSFTYEDITKIVISNEDIFKMLYDKNDIEYILTKCNKLSEVKNKYNKIWQYINRNNLHYLLDGVKSRDYIHMDDDSFIKYIGITFNTYKQFTKHKCYQLIRKRKLLNRVKELYRDSTV